MQKNSIPAYLSMKTVTIDASNYIEATFKMDKMYPSERYVKQLHSTSDGVWPNSYTLWPKLSLRESGEDGTD